MGKMINFEDAYVDAQIRILLEELDEYQKTIQEVSRSIDIADEELETELKRRSIPLHLV